MLHVALCHITYEERNRGGTTIHNAAKSDTKERNLKNSLSGGFTVHFEI